MYFGDKFEYNSVPFFWTRSFETTIGFAGSAKDYDDIIYSPLSDFETASKPKWVAFYVKGDKVIGVCACNFFNYPTAAVVLLAEGRMPSASAIKEKPDIDLVALANQK